MISVDAVTGEIYLQLQPKSKTEEVAMYFSDLCKDAHSENIEKVSIVLDNNSTHKVKMKRLLQEHLHRLNLTDKITVDFLHTPSYSPEFNLAEYEIHQLRLLKLHHLPANITIPDIEKKLESVKSLMKPDQIAKTLDHIFALVPASIS